VVQGVRGVQGVEGDEHDVDRVRRDDRARAGVRGEEHDGRVHHDQPPVGDAQERVPGRRALQDHGEAQDVHQEGVRTGGGILPVRDAGDDRDARRQQAGLPHRGPRVHGPLGVEDPERHLAAGPAPPLPPEPASPGVLPRARGEGGQAVLDGEEVPGGVGFGHVGLRDGQEARGQGRHQRGGPDHGVQPELPEAVHPEGQGEGAAVLGPHREGGAGLLDAQDAKLA